MRGAGIRAKAAETNSAPLNIQFAWCLLPTAGLVVALFWLWRANAPWTFPLDDAYITQHNALAILAGRDASFGGSPLLGSTSLFHLSLVTGAIALLPGEPTFAQFLVSALGAVVYASGVAALVVQARVSFLRSCAAFFAAATMGMAAFQLLSGLETGWAMATVAWAIWLANRQPSVALAALCGVMPFVRPELGVLSLALLARQALLRRNAKAIALDVAAAAACALPYAIWSLAALGTVLPNTIAAKRAFFTAPWSLALVAAEVELTIIMGAGPLFAAWVLAPGCGVKWALSAFTAVFLAAYLIVAPQFLDWNHGRYLAPLLPAGIWTYLQNAKRKYIGAILAVAIATWGAMTIPLTATAYRTGTAQTHDGIAAARWLKDHASEGSKVLVHDDGTAAIGAPRLKLIDIVGLKTPWIARLNEQISFPSKGRLRPLVISLAAARFKTTYMIVLNDGVGHWWSLMTQIRRYGWHLLLIRRPAIQNGYDVYALSAPRPEKP